MSFGGGFVASPTAYMRAGYDKEVDRQKQNRLTDLQTQQAALGLEWDQAKKKEWDEQADTRRSNAEATAQWNTAKADMAQGQYDEWEDRKAYRKQLEDIAMAREQFGLERAKTMLDRERFNFAQDKKTSEYQDVLDQAAYNSAIALRAAAGVSDAGFWTGEKLVDMLQETFGMMKGKVGKTTFAVSDKPGVILVDDDGPGGKQAYELPEGKAREMLLRMALPETFVQMDLQKRTAEQAPRQYVTDQGRVISATPSQISAQGLNVRPLQDVKAEQELRGSGKSPFSKSSLGATRKVWEESLMRSRGYVQKPLYDDQTGTTYSVYVDKDGNQAGPEVMQEVEQTMKLAYMLTQQGADSQRALDVAKQQVPIYTAARKRWIANGGDLRDKEGFARYYARFKQAAMGNGSYDRSAWTPGYLMHGGNAPVTGSQGRGLQIGGN